jgi:hypothetical protein
MSLTKAKLFRRTYFPSSFLALRLISICDQHLLVLTASILSMAV